MLGERKFVRWLFHVKVVNAKIAVTIVVLTHWNFIMLIQLGKILIFSAKVIREAGKKLNLSWISAQYYVQIAIENFTQN